IRSVRVLLYVAGWKDRKGQRSGECGGEGVGVLAVAWHRAGGLVVLIRFERRRHPERDCWRRDRHVLEVTLGVDPLAGRCENEIAVEAIRAGGLSCGHLDRIREWREVARAHDVLGVRRVRGRRQPTAREG